MGDYVDGKNILLRRPEPGRTNAPSPKVITKNTVAKNELVNTDAIADAIIKAIQGKIPISRTENVIINTKDDFDTTKSLEKLAGAMSEQTEIHEGNVSGIGNIKETKRDKAATDKTIDLLSGLGD